MASKIREYFILDSKGNWPKAFREMPEHAKPENVIHVIAKQDLQPLLKKIEKYLNEDIATLECESRVRTMKEETWEYGMLLRDELESLLKAFNSNEGGENNG